MHRIACYIEQVARVPTPRRPVPPSPPRMGSLKIVFNRNGQWLAVIRGHYRVASRKRERGATHQPQSTSREREHRPSRRPFPLRESEASLSHPLTFSTGDCRGSITALAATTVAAHPPNGERNESEPNPLHEQQQCVQILYTVRYFDAPSAQPLGSHLPAAKVKPGFILSVTSRK